ncbi:DUF4153 domain-containing protein [Micromonospora inyonensis]|uniref:Uncharacterized protein n=1 Tax=Micromonospora inyonensis TaxID=47866 RepID=A0A1C6S7S6_9ACTN|nr:DUF4153 domain-containing protein [Micromonospora inyonensis]SCL25526.1 hypothetical protein GA0074694_4244 [Micromonospora inyonensis]
MTQPPAPRPSPEDSGGGTMPPYLLAMLANAEVPGAVPWPEGQPAWAIPVDLPPGTRGYAVFIPLVPVAGSGPVTTDPSAAAGATTSGPPVPKPTTSGPAATPAASTTPPTAGTTASGPAPAGAARPGPTSTVDTPPAGAPASASGGSSAASAPAAPVAALLGAPAPAGTRAATASGPGGPPPPATAPTTSGSTPPARTFGPPVHLVAVGGRPGVPTYPGLAGGFYRPKPPGPSFLQRYWPGPKPARGRAVPAAVGVGALGLAFFVPLSRTGIGWFLGWLAVTVAVVFAVRRAVAELPRSERWVRAGWAGAALALLAVPAFRNAWWLVTFCVLVALGCAALGVVGGRRIRSILFSLVAAPTAAFRGLPWVRAHFRSPADPGLLRRVVGPWSPPLAP